MNNAARKLNSQKPKIKKAKVKSYQEILREKRIREEKRQTCKKVASFLCTIFLFASLITGNLCLRVEISETHNQVDKAEKEIKSLESEKALYETEIERMFSYKVLWEEAEKLGLQPRSDAQIHKIKSEQKDYAEIVKKN